jgi:tight adherence protein B
MTVLAAVCLVGAGMLLLPQPPHQRLARLAKSGRTNRHLGLIRLASPGLVVLAGLGGLVIAGTAGLAAAGSVALVAVTVFQLWRRRRRAGRAAELSLAVVDACQLLAGLLRVGHIPVMALRLAAVDCSVFAEADAAQRVGASVSAVLRRQSLAPGGSGLSELAVAWEIAERTGASLTATLDALAERLEAASRVARVVAAELAAPRATGRMLAALPIVGLMLGYGIGGDPGAFLLGSVFGQLCLTSAVALACGGVWWIERLSESVGV